MVKNNTLKELSRKYIKERYAKSFFGNIGIAKINTDFKNSLFEILENRLFFALKLILKYEFNTSKIKSKKKFLNNFFSDCGFQNICNKYKCLENLINSEVSQTSNFVKVFVQRLNSNLKDISEGLFDLPYIFCLDDITNLETELSDRHYDSSTVIIIEFKSKYKVVYKPRSLGVDILFHDIIGKINLKLKEKIFLCPKSINKGSYGWQEFVETKECTSKSEISRYYERQGANLALVYLLGGTDLHNENIIAHGEYPIIIDIETITQPPIIKNKADSKNDLKKFLEKAYSMISDSVYRTGMISNYTKKGVDFSAFGGDLVIKDGKSCSPIYNGERIKIVNNIDNVIKGFSKYIGNINAIIKNEIPNLNNDYKGIEIRYINRATQYYYDIICASLHPEVMIDIDKRINFILKYLKEKSKSKTNILVNSEVEQIRKLNIPKYTTTLESKDLSLGKKIYKKLLTINTLEELSRINSKEIDLINERKIIMNSYLTSIHNSETKLVNDKNYHYTNTKGFSFDEKIDDVYKIVKRSIIQSNNYLVFPTTIAKGKYLSYGLGKGDLYDGVLGVALFFAAYGKIRNNQDSIRLAKKAFITGKEMIKKEEYNESLFSGRYGIIYVGLVLWHILNDNKYFETAFKDFKDLIKLPKMNKDLDIISGVSGKLITCLELYKHFKDAKVLKYIEKYKKIIIENYNKFGFKGESIPETLKLTGFSHGIAGIVYALSKYNNEIVYNEEIAIIIKKLINRENRFFSKKKKNRNSNKDKVKKFQYSWCYGAPGIILSRNLLKDFSCDKYIKSSLENYENFVGKKKSDCLCHGSLGNFDILSHIGGVHSSINPINKKLKRKIKNFEKEWISGLAGNCYSIGLMTGYAGIGYSLLRFESNNILPSILAIETGYQD